MVSLVAYHQFTVYTLHSFQSLCISSLDHQNIYPWVSLLFVNDEAILTSLKMNESDLDFKDHLLSLHMQSSEENHQRKNISLFKK